MVLVTFALTEEGRVFRRRLTNRQKRDGIVCGSVTGIEVGICRLGIRASKRAHFEAAICKFEPSWVLSSGFAGSTRSLVVPGDFVLSENFSDPELVAQIKVTRLIDATGKFLSLSEVAGPESKLRLNRLGDTLAVDMESAIVAEICRSAGTPIVTARMISDALQERIPKIFLGERMIRPEDWIEAAKFSGRMLRLTGKLAVRLEGLLRYLDGKFAFRNVPRLP
jgi:nucleoside phosphorylase